MLYHDPPPPIPPPYSAFGDLKFGWSHHWDPVKLPPAENIVIMHNRGFFSLRVDWRGRGDREGWGTL